MTRWDLAVERMPLPLQRLYWPLDHFYRDAQGVLSRELAYRRQRLTGVDLHREMREFAALELLLGDPSHAAGMCGYAAHEFACVVGGRVWHLLGCRTSFPCRNPLYQNYVDPDPDLYHMVAEKNGLFIDFTRRQFDPKAPFPFVQMKHQVKREWRKMSLFIPKEIE